MTYLDRYAKDAEGLTRSAPPPAVPRHHPPPSAPALSGPGRANDGGYAVSDYRTLRPDLGSMKDLRRIDRELSTKPGIGVVLDLICNHTSSEHPWAQAARAGNPEFADFYFFFPDRSTPDALSPHLRSIFPDRGGDAFTWHEGTADLRLLGLDHLLSLPVGPQLPQPPGPSGDESGNALPRQPGSARRSEWMPLLSCGRRREPPARTARKPTSLLRIMRILADLACPSVQFLSEAIVHPDEVKEFVNPVECQLGYNPLLMTSIWDALATDDVRFLDLALGERSHAPARM